MEPIIRTTAAELAAAFAEWDRRYREEPERFATEAQMAADSVETLGEAQANYLLVILAEQFLNS